jgi:hypothetical protein
MTVMAWTRLGDPAKRGKFYYADFRCDCGKVKSKKCSIEGRVFKGAKCRACSNADSSARCRAGVKHGHAKKGARTPTYLTWADMLKRCENETATHFASYGGRGIKVCDRWHDFAHFLADMGERPTGMSIDRINNDGNYEPGNCRWASDTEQANNKTTSHLVTAGGETKTVAMWARSQGLPREVIRGRLRLGWEPNRAVFTPSKGRARGTG